MAPAAVETTPQNGVENGVENGASNGHGLEKVIENVKAVVGKSETTQKTEPLKLSGALDTFESFDVTPVIGREFPTANLVDWLNAPNADELIRDLAITSTFPGAPNPGRD